MIAKRVVDLAIAVPVGLIGLVPMMLVALSVRLRLGSPVLYRSIRPGKDGRPFTLLKFRTMTEARRRSGELLPDDERLTPFGRWLRSTSLDELPELWNVIIGDMSLVGPRPLLMEYLDRYSPDQMRRHAVRPGLTGLAQVRGRNATSWERRFRLDTWYVDHCSLALDLRILRDTVLVVVRRKGISASGHATMPEFLGDNRP